MSCFDAVEVHLKFTCNFTIFHMPSPDILPNINMCVFYIQVLYPFIV